MSIMRRLSLLAIGALLVMAVAASAASATTVRSGSTSGSPYTGSVTSTLQSGTTSDFFSGFVNINCDQSTIGGSLANSNGTGVSVSSASWTDSSTGGGGCPNNIGSTSASTAIGLPWSGGNVTYVPPTVPPAPPGPDGTLTIANVDVSINNFGTICEYKGSGANNSVTGNVSNSAGTVQFTNAGLTKVSGNFLCSGTATYSGTYDLRGSGGVRLYVTP